MMNDEKRLKTGLVIMASGLGKRFGSNKLMELLENKPLIQWVIDATEGLFDGRIVVTRSSSVYDLCNKLNIPCILHEFPGRNDTVRLGLRELAQNCDYCFFMQGDQPLISSQSVDRMIKEAVDNRDKIVRATYGDIAGAPIGFPRRFYDELLTLPEGKGGNYIAKMYPSEVCSVDVIHEYELWDIDTQDDLKRIKNVIDEI